MDLPHGSCGAKREGMPNGGHRGGGRGLRTRICIDMGSQCGGFLEGGVGASANLRVCGGVAGCLWLGCTAPRWRCRFFP